MRNFKLDKCTLTLVTMVGTLVIFHINYLIFPFQTSVVKSKPHITEWTQERMKSLPERTHVRTKSLPERIRVKMKPNSERTYVRMKPSPQRTQVGMKPSPKRTPVMMKPRPERTHVRMKLRPKVPMMEGKSAGGKQHFFNDKCILVPPEGERPIKLPSQMVLNNYNLHDMACLFNRYLSSLQTLCNRPLFMGETANGGVMYCSDIEPKPSGNVYFFESGIDEFRQLLLDLVFRFQTNTTYLYRTSSLKISLNISKGLFRQIQETQSFRRIADSRMNIWPLFIELSTLNALIDALETKSINNVQVIIMKLRYEVTTYTKEGLRRWLEALWMLYTKNFRIYWFDRSFHCVSKIPYFNNCFTICFIKRNSSLNISSDIFTLPTKSVILNMSDSTAVETYQTFSSIFQYHCKELVRMGNTRDGGWEVCIDKKYAPSASCLVYSFGIGNDWSFDESMSNTFSCEVYSYDPSLDLPIHMHSPGVHFYNIGISAKNTNTQAFIIGANNIRKGTWKLRTLHTLLKDNGHLNRRIDVLKMDVEGAEWGSIPNMISTGVLKNVYQLNIEFHGEGNRDQLMVIRQLYDEGFRIFWMHRNPASCNNYIYANFLPNCRYLEIYFVNTYV